MTLKETDFSVVYAGYVSKKKRDDLERIAREKRLNCKIASPSELNEMLQNGLTSRIYVLPELQTKGLNKDTNHASLDTETTSGKTISLIRNYEPESIIVLHSNLSNKNLLEVIAERHGVDHICKPHMKLLIEDIIFKYLKSPKVQYKTTLD